MTEEVTSDPEPFPRGTSFPGQSPLFWVDQKDRYLRQLLIRDIERKTGRPLVVYYTDCSSNAQIDQYDDQYLVELLSDVQGKALDMLLETNGGATDATEKLVTILGDRITDLRVIVPRRAKSNGTLLALAAVEIWMGCGSELGPVDPNLQLQPNVFVPAQFILKANQPLDPIVTQAADHAVRQTQKLASNLLKNGMLKGKNDTEINTVVSQLSTRELFHSHGSVIGVREAEALGLRLRAFPDDDPLWRWIWLLRCMYDVDAKRAGAVKIFEGRRVSNSIRPA